ncbi:hypothetical protein GCM10010199_09020 [Dactylosporangium roseum]
MMQELDGVREGGGDDRDAGGDRLGEHAGGDLLGRVVGQDHHVRRADEAAQGLLVEVAGPVVHGVRDPELRAEAVQPGAVRLAVPREDLGWV